MSRLSFSLIVCSDNGSLIIVYFNSTSVCHVFQWEALLDWILVFQICVCVTASRAKLGRADSHFCSKVQSYRDTMWEPLLWLVSVDLPTSFWCWKRLLIMKATLSKTYLKKKQKTVNYLGLISLWFFNILQFYTIWMLFVYISWNVIKTWKVNNDN